MKVERKLKVEISGKRFLEGKQKVDSHMQAKVQRRPIAIAVASAKGGSMKSSLCAALAVQAVATGARVDLLDWEPQGSLTYWWTVRGKPDNPRLLTGFRVTPAEAAANSDADWLLFDTAPAMLEKVERAVEAADYVLIPLLASALDLVAARTVVSICADHGKPFGFLLTRVNSQRDTLNNSASEHLRKLGVLLWPPVIDRAAYVSAMANGKTAAEHPDSRQRHAAREEIEAVWTAVRKAATKAVSK